MTINERRAGPDQGNISVFKGYFSRNRRFACLEGHFGLEIIAVRSLEFGETGFVIRSANPASLRLHPKFALYDLDKFPAPGGNSVNGDPQAAEGCLGHATHYRPWPN